MSYFNNYPGQVNQQQGPYTGIVGAPLYQMTNVPQQPVNFVQNTFPPPVVAGNFVPQSVEHNVLSRVGLLPGSHPQPMKAPHPGLHTTSQVPVYASVPHPVVTKSTSVPSFSPAPMKSPTEIEKTCVSSSIRSRAIPIVAPTQKSGRTVSLADLSLKSKSNPIVSPAVFEFEGNSVTPKQEQITASKTTEAAVFKFKGNSVTPKKEKITAPKTTETAVVDRSIDDQIYDKFAAVLEEYGPLKPASDLILGKFIALPSQSRKIVMGKGSVKNFLLDSDRIEMKDGLLYLQKLPTEIDEEEPVETEDPDDESAYLSDDNTRSSSPTEEAARDEVLDYNNELFSEADMSAFELQLATLAKSLANDVLIKHDPESFLKHEYIEVEEEWVHCTDGPESDHVVDNTVKQNFSEQIDCESEWSSRSSPLKLDHSTGESLSNWSSGWSRTPSIEEDTTSTSSNATGDIAGKSATVGINCTQTTEVQKDGFPRTASTQEDTTLNPTYPAWSAATDVTETSALSGVKREICADPRVIVCDSPGNDAITGERAIPKEFVPTTQCGRPIENCTNSSVPSIGLVLQNSISERIPPQGDTSMVPPQQNRSIIPPVVQNDLASWAKNIIHTPMNQQSMPTNIPVSLRVSSQSYSQMDAGVRCNTPVLVQQNVPVRCSSQPPLLTPRTVTVVGAPNQVALLPNQSLNVSAHEFHPRDSTPPVPLVQVRPPVANYGAQQNYVAQTLSLTENNQPKTIPQSSLNISSPEFKPQGSTNSGFNAPQINTPVFKQQGFVNSGCIAPEISTPVFKTQVSANSGCNAPQINVPIFKPQGSTNSGCNAPQISTPVFKPLGFPNSGCNAPQISAPVFKPQGSTNSGRNVPQISAPVFKPQGSTNSGCNVPQISAPVFKPQGFPNSECNGPQISAPIFKPQCSMNSGCSAPQVNAPVFKPTGFTNSGHYDPQIRSPIFKPQCFANSGCNVPKINLPAGFASASNNVPASSSPFLSAPIVVTMETKCDQSTSTSIPVTKDRGTGTEKLECRDLGVQSVQSTLNVAEVCVNTTESMFDPDSMHHMVETKNIGVGTKHVGDSIEKSTQTGSRGNVFLVDFECQANLSPSVPQATSGEDILETQYQALLQQMMVTLLQTNPAMMSDPKSLRRTAYQHLLTMLGKESTMSTSSSNHSNSNTMALMQQPDLVSAASGLFNPFMGMGNQLGMPMMPNCMPMPNLFGMPPMFNSNQNTAAFNETQQSFNANLANQTCDNDNADLPAGKKLKNIPGDSEPDQPPPPTQPATEPTPTKSGKGKKKRSKKKSGTAVSSQSSVQSPPVENFKPVLGTDHGFHFTEKEDVTFKGNSPNNITNEDIQKSLGDLRPPNSTMSSGVKPKNKSSKKKKKNSGALSDCSTITTSSLTSMSSGLESAESRPDTPVQQSTSSMADGPNPNRNNSNCATVPPGMLGRDIVPDNWEDEADPYATGFKLQNMAPSQIKLPNSAMPLSIPSTTSSQCSSPDDGPTILLQPSNTKSKHIAPTSSAASDKSISQIGESLSQVKLALDFDQGDMDKLDEITELPKSRRLVRPQRSSSSSPEVPDFMPGYLRRPESIEKPVVQKSGENTTMSITRPPGISTAKSSSLSSKTVGSSVCSPKTVWSKLEDERSQVKVKIPKKADQTPLTKAPRPIPPLMNLDVNMKPDAIKPKMSTLTKTTKTQGGFPSIARDSGKVSELCTIEVGQAGGEKTEQQDVWQQVGMKKKRSREASNPVSTVPANLIGRKMVSLVGQKESPEKKVTNFDRLIAKMREKFPALERSQVLSLLNDVRRKRGTLKGVAMGTIVSDATEIIAKRKAAAASTLPQNKPSVSSTKISLCASVRKGKVCQVKAKCVFAHSEAEVERNKAAMYMASKTPSNDLTENAAAAAAGSTLAVSETDFDFVNSDEEPDSKECPICKSHIRLSYGTRLDCGHEFHQKCIKAWVVGQERTCPMCRQLTLLKDEFPTLGS